MKNYFLKFPSLLKFLKPLPTADTDKTKRNSTMTAKFTVDKDFNYSADRTPAGNTGLAKVAV
jgi:hypothetical protein